MLLLATNYWDIRLPIFYKQTAGVIGLPAVCCLDRLDYVVNGPEIIRVEITKPACKARIRI